MVVHPAICTRSPQAAVTEKCRRNRETRRLAYAGCGICTGLLGMETDRDQFAGFVRRSFPLGFADGIDGGLAQEWMSAGQRGGFYGVVWCDHSFHFHGSGNVHGTRKPGIVWGDPGHHFSPALGLVLS